MKEKQASSFSSRREFIKSAASTAVVAGVAGSSSLAQESANAGSDRSRRAKPNIVLYIADQMRWDFIRAYGLNPTTKTPNLDKVFNRGVTFTSAVTNQPLCSPSRAGIMTGRYATETGVWRNGLQLRRDLPTLASVLRGQGYTANLIGKWHLSGAGNGFVLAEDRGGFLDLWEGADALELTSHPYYGTIWDGQGRPMRWTDEYRVDFLTDRAVRFLKQPQQKPFLLYVSQLEPHFQNDEGRFVAPKGYADRFRNPYVPPDLLHLPGNWQAQLPDYYGDIEKIDESVGRILQTLEEQKILDNTIFLFTSDHGCHFETRNQEYKRSPQDASIRIPFLMQGPGLDRSLQLPEIVQNIDLTPTLLDAVGVEVPSSMKGRSLMPLVRDPQARVQWDNKALIQISESMVARAIRTKEWTYCVADPSLPGGKVASSNRYQEYVMYNNFSDPAQLVNLAGRAPFQQQAAMLREDLTNLIAASGEPKPTIAPARLYP
ncbi:MAG: sulfatase-like hydrolase/transferase [Acidobacteriaceae bacterium]